jgi:hypothetical protein
MISRMRTAIAASWLASDSTAIVPPGCPLSGLRMDRHAE